MISALEPRFGLRFIVDSSGIGREISLVPIVIQLSSCLALVQIASMAADFLMVRMWLNGPQLGVRRGTTKPAARPTTAARS